MSKIKILTAALLTVSLLAVACGSDDEQSETVAATQAEPVAEPADEEPEEVEPADEEPGEDEPAEDAMGEDAVEDEPADAGDLGGYPVTIDTAGGPLTIESQPQRIVSLSPTATEMLFAIGAGDQVIAADAFSNYPPEAPVTELSGFDPNVEAVLAFEPDLVVISFDANDLTASLTSAGVPVLLSSAPFDIEGGYDVIAELGLAVGRVDETAEVVATMRSEIDAAFAEAPQVPLRIYHEIDDTFYSASSFGFIGAVYAQMGVTNIADAGDTDGFGFPQLTEEYIVEQDPEVIIITDQVGYTPDDVAARPGWDQVSAVTSGNIVVVDADVSSRWGPRLPQFITTIAQALSSAAVPA